MCPWLPLCLQSNLNESYWDEEDEYAQDLRQSGEEGMGHQLPTGAAGTPVGEIRCCMPATIASSFRPLKRLGGDLRMRIMNEGPWHFPGLACVLAPEHCALLMCKCATCPVQVMKTWTKTARSMQERMLHMNKQAGRSRHVSCASFLDTMNSRSALQDRWGQYEAPKFQCSRRSLARG
eukprot:1157631-Pelagomonas_calceolata.AAC.2